MQGILPYLISGISVGGQYALIAIGYTLVYGILRLINFAHGDVFMVAGLIMVYTTASMPMYISIPLVLIFTVILGFAIERVAYKPLRTAPRMSLMISAIGVSYLIQNLAFYLTGGLPQPVKTPIPWISDTVTLFGASTKRVTVVTPVLTIALVFALVALIKKTKIGMGMRAAAKDFETAQLMGVKINSVISMTFVIGSFLAAVGAMLYFTNYPTVAITSGGMPGLKAFVAAVFGGIGSIPGAVVGAFLIGLCEEIIKGLGQSTFSDAFTFALLIIVLCVKPTGLFGEKVTDKERFHRFHKDGRIPGNFPAQGFGHVVPARVIVERQGQPPFIGSFEVGSAKGKGINSLFRHGFADRHQLVKGGGNFPAVFRHHIRVVEQEYGLGGGGDGVELTVIAAGIQGPIHYVSGPVVGFSVSAQVGGQAVDGELHTVSRPIGAVDVRAAVGGQSGLQYAVIIALPYGFDFYIGIGRLKGGDDLLLNLAHQVCVGVVGPPGDGDGLFLLSRRGQNA